MDTVLPTSMGARGLVSMHNIAQPMNAFLFRKAKYGTSVKVVGRFEGPILGQCMGASKKVFFHRRLVAVDEGKLLVLHGDHKDINVFTGFVEVIGSKGGDEVLYATAILPLGDDLDVSLWNEACLMMQYPELRSLFTCMPVESSDDVLSPTQVYGGPLCQVCGREHTDDET